MPTKAYSLRINDERIARINAALARRINANQPEWNLTEFILKAIDDKLDHLDRSRGASKRKANVAILTTDTAGIVPAESTSPTTTTEEK